MSDAQNPPAPGSSPDEEQVLDGIGPALSRLRRRAPGTGKDLARNVLLNVICDAAGEITVGEVAVEMAYLQSAASRLISACIAEGLVRRVASQGDGRRTVLELTAQGEVQRRRYAAEQRRAFEEITGHWSSDDRLMFARLARRYSHDSAAYGRARNSPAVHAD
ncbi:MarR family winged helix-turn-helix transcriptional regulator [Kitasatospora sp. NPDC057223]|uniref:MarR family winged helix-turn-helix transcriptional regulator n=1 Tax=Kitasatospora sp. NPDC057223 TaxID=3346055 RepID=UPI00362A4085